MKSGKKGEVTLKRGTLLVLIVLILVLLILVVFLCLKKDIDTNISDIVDKQEVVESNSIKIPGYSYVTIEKDSKDVQIALVNPDGNPCYFTYELILKDNNETLYKTKLIPPGKMISDIRLNRPLEKGEYKAFIRVTTTSLSDNSPMNGADLETVLIVR